MIHYFTLLLSARSRLYRRRSLQVNTCVKTLDEIYKIYMLLHLWNPIEKPWKALRASVLRTRHTVPRKRSYPALLHRSELKKSAKFRQTFSHFCSFILNIVLIFCNSGSKFTKFDQFWTFFEIYIHLLTAVQISVIFRPFAPFFFFAKFKAIVAEFQGRLQNLAVFFKFSWTFVRFQWFW